MNEYFYNKSVLVTGGAGFIGSHLVKNLVKLKARVFVTVKYHSIIDNIRLSIVWDKINVIEVDLRNLDSVLKIKNLKFDTIFHLAAYNHVGDSFGNFNESIQSNFISTCNLLDYGPKFRKFIYMSTSEVYGHQHALPFDEKNNPNPISPYSISKYSGELYAKMKQGLDSRKSIINIVRAFNTYGPYQSEKAVIPEVITKCLLGQTINATLGHQTREFNYVTDIVAGLLKIVKLNQSFDGAINLGTGKDISIRDLIKKIHKLTNSKSKIKIGKISYRPTEIFKMFANNQLAKTQLKWKPKVGFEEGLIKSIDWYKNYIDIFYNLKSTLNKLK